MSVIASTLAWFDRTFLDLGRELRWSFLPPLMVYFAAGISGLTAIVGTFFVKEQLDLSAVFLASLGFWVGIPWALKMPLGHIVDLIWRFKAALVWLGAGLVALSLIIMYLLVSDRAALAALASIEAWYTLATLLAPVGYVLQDVVADAMTVEAVPTHDDDGTAIAEARLKAMHTTMQTLGRIAVVGGLVAVALLNIVMFEGIETMSAADKTAIYARIYLLALAVPLLSVSGVVLAAALAGRSRAAAGQAGAAHPGPAKVAPDWPILGGSLVFVAVTLGLGIADLPGNQELIFVGSLAIIGFLIRQLVQALPADQRATLIGTAVVIFVFRATPTAEPGVSWWQIDVLGFDQQFLSALALPGSILTLIVMVALRPLLARRSIAEIVVVLSLLAGLLALPSIGLFWGLHHWTARISDGWIDARFIAVLNTSIESPLGQIAMIPMLAWIARSAPPQLKATFFAVMASFTNLALAAGSLIGKHLNTIFVVRRELRDPASAAVTVPADYDQLGLFLITVAVITLTVPILAVLLVQASRWRIRS